MKIKLKLVNKENYEIPLIYYNCLSDSKCINLLYILMIKKIMKIVENRRI